MDKTALGTAQKIVKQVADEPLEILKNIPDQVVGGDRRPEGTQETTTQQANQGISQQKPLQNPDELYDKQRSIRLVEAYQRELEDIRKQDLFADLQAKVSQGIEVPLQDFPTLSMEQKQVLKAQMEAVKVRRAKLGVQQSELVEPATRRSRRLFHFGKKQEVKRQQERVENLVPPSG
jgi:hypothetical protein